MTSEPALAEARRLLEELSKEPRPAGGRAEADARRFCIERLKRLGFRVAEEPFEYSSFPGRWATSASGVLALIVLLLASLAGATGRPALSLALLGGTGAALGIFALWVMRRGVLEFPLARERGLNVTAVRGEPKVWLVAHLDSKSQPVPIVVRALGVSGTIIVWVAATAVAALQLTGWNVSDWWPWLGAAGVLVSLPVALSVVQARSAGAIDNASGVAALLLAAAALPETQPVGVLLTSAEELGLAGARAWVRGRPPARAINFDGLDDEGRLRFTFTGRRPHAVLEALGDSARRSGTDAVAGRLFPGVLLDGVALADADWEVATVSRGSLSTVSRVHTSSDVLGDITGGGVALAARVAADAVPVLG